MGRKAKRKTRRQRKIERDANDQCQRSTPAAKGDADSSQNAEIDGVWIVTDGESKEELIQFPDEEEPCETDVWDDSQCDMVYNAWYMNETQAQYPDLKSYITRGGDVNYRNKKGWTLLHQNVLVGYLHNVKLLLRLGADVNAANRFGTTPLMLARRSEIVRILLEHKPDLYAVSKNNGTALHHAIIGNHIECLKLLLHEIPDVNQMGNTCEPLVIKATTKDNIECLRALIKEGAHVNARSKSETAGTALHFAAYQGKLRHLKELLKAGADITAKDNNGDTALHCSAMNGKVACMKELLSSGADVNSVNLDGYTALLVASDCGHCQCLRELLSASANVNSVNSQGDTALILASGHGHYCCVKELLASCADINITNTEGYTALEVSLEIEEDLAVACLSEFIAVGADVNRRVTDQKVTPLMEATKSEKEKCVKYLIEFGADVNAVDADGESALFMAAIGGWEVGIKTLLGAGACFSVKNDNGLTALHNAATGGNVKCIEALLKSGANINAQTNNGATAIMAAVQENQFQAFKLLIAKGADVNLVYGENKGTVLMYAAEKKLIDYVKELLKAGANFNASTLQGCTALHSAAYLGLDDMIDLIDLLIKAGADVDKKDDGQKTPVFVAAEAGHEKCVEKLIQAESENSKVNSEAVELAVDTGNYDCLQLLLKKGAKVNLDVDDYLCKHKNMKSVDTLLCLMSVGLNKDKDTSNTSDEDSKLQKGLQDVVNAGINILDRGLLATLALVGSSKANKKATKMLIKAGADVNGKIKLSSSPLMEAAAKGREGCVKLLLKHGAREEDLHVARDANHCSSAPAELSVSDDLDSGPEPDSESY